MVGETWWSAGERRRMVQLIYSGADQRRVRPQTGAERARYSSLLSVLCLPSVVHPPLCMSNKKLLQKRFVSRFSIVVTTQETGTL